MKIQIISDIHLEFRRENFINLFIPNAPILCMVGDICACGNPEDYDIFIKFLKYITPKYKYIFHVAGNHEYYTAGAPKKELSENTMQKINLRLKNLTKIYPNYHFLNNEIYEITTKQNKNIIFIGTTLWSYIPPDLYGKIQKSMNDYNYIYVKKDKGVRLYTVEDMQKNHKKAVIFIKQILKNANSKNTYILLTHHKPIFDRNTIKQDILTYAYESALQDVIIKPPLKLAAHGHTHIPYDKMINKVRVISNPKGYIHEKTKFNDKLSIYI